MVYVSVGSNIPDARGKVEDAIRFLSSLLDGIECSSLYETPCMRNASAPAYTNAVVGGTTFYNGGSLVRIFKSYERIKGRTGDKGDGVVIDLDLVACDGEILRERDFNALHFQIGLKDIDSWQR